MFPFSVPLNWLAGACSGEARGSSRPSDHAMRTSASLGDGPFHGKHATKKVKDSDTELWRIRGLADRRMMLTWIACGENVLLSQPFYRAPPIFSGHLPHSPSLLQPFPSRRTAQSLGLPPRARHQPGNSVHGASQLHASQPGPTVRLAVAEPVTE